MKMFITSKQNINCNCEKVDFPHHASWSIQFIQDVIGKQVQQHHHQDRQECLSWECGVV